MKGKVFEKESFDKEERRGRTRESIVAKNRRRQPEEKNGSEKQNPGEGGGGGHSATEGLGAGRIWLVGCEMPRLQSDTRFLPGLAFSRRTYRPPNNTIAPSTTCTVCQNYQPCTMH